jgi:hypothetical protein
MYSGDGVWHETVDFQQIYTFGGDKKVVISSKMGMISQVMAFL